MAILPEVKKHYGKLKLLIDGEWLDSSSTQIHEDVNPATGEVIAEFPTATKEEARAAVEAAQRGFEAMKRIPLRERARMLFDMRQRFEERFDPRPRPNHQGVSRFGATSDREHRISVFGSLRPCGPERASGRACQRH